jgi:hypothetical protein
VTEATVAASGDVGGVELECLGPQAFKNVSGQVSVYSARQVREPARTAALHALPSLVPVAALSPTSA